MLHACTDAVTLEGRLGEVRERWDPLNVFHTSRNIKPA